jgi:hypothetical protein
MHRSTSSGLRITPEVAIFYNYQVSLPSVEAEVSVYAKGAPPRRDVTGFQSHRQREEDERERLTVSSRIWERRSGKTPQK